MTYREKLPSIGTVDLCGLVDLDRAEQVVIEADAEIAGLRADAGREPTPEECAAIHKEWMRAHGIEGYGAVCNGRAMFDAVSAVMWPKSEGL